MKHFNLVDPKEIALLERVNEVYIREGMKRTTMDDMSRILNVSKKTLYKYVKNRKELVMKSIFLHIQKDRQKVIEIQKQNLNPLIEQHEVAKFVTEKISKLNPIIHYDLEHFFPESWDLLNEYFNGFVLESILKNLSRGQEEGEYRTDFKPTIIAKLFTNRLNIIFDGELFPENEFNFKDVYLEYLTYHLNSIVSEKGKTTLNKLDFKQL